MKYLYFSIYMFYKKIIRIEYWGDKPFFYCSLLISLFEGFLIFILLNYYLLYTSKGNYIGLSKMFSFIVVMLLFFINTKYFKNKEAKIIKELSSKSKKDKIVIFFISFVILAFIVFFYFHTGTLIRDHNVSD